jgi:hypothetical protein
MYFKRRVPLSYPPPYSYTRCLDDCANPQLDTVTLRLAPSDTVMIRPTNVFILRQSDPTGVGQSDQTQTAQFDPLEVGLNVGCDHRWALSPLSVISNIGLSLISELTNSD